MLEHWHPQLIREEAALVLSRDREVALSTRVARMVVWVNIVSSGCFIVKDKNVLEFLLIYVVYIQMERGKFRSGGLSFMVKIKCSDRIIVCSG